MSQHCRANPCCGERPCEGVPLPQHASGYPSRNLAPQLSELDDMVASAIEAAIETSPEFNHGWRSMPDKELIPEILDEIPIEYTKKDVAEAIYRYKIRRLLGKAPTEAPPAESQAAEIARLRNTLQNARITILDLKNARGSEAEGSDEEWVSDIDAALAAEGSAE